MGTTATAERETVKRVRRTKKMVEVEQAKGRPGQIKEIVREAITKHRVFDDAAAEVGVVRQTLWEWREKFGLEVQDSF